MLSKDFMKLVFISFVAAVPVGQYSVSQWLEGFAYRVDVTMTVFLIAGATALFIAWITVGFESLKSARSNPITSLRSE